jgi:hypothetical protein
MMDDSRNLLFVCELRDGDDKVTWKIVNKGFTVKSVHDALQTKPLPSEENRMVWGYQLPTTCVVPLMRAECRSLNLSVLHC